MADLQWPQLLKRLREKRCTPVIGAGASYPYLPLARDLAKELIEADHRDSTRVCPLPDQTDLAKVCQYLAVVNEDAISPKIEIAKYIQSGRKPDFTDSADPHGLLADLQLPLYITTNYDDFLASAIRARGRIAHQDFTRWTRELLEGQSSVFDSGLEPTDIEPVIFHLHGHTGCPRAMVASEDDYLDFLVNVSKDLAISPTGPNQRVMLPLPVRTAVSTTTLLFVGYSLADVNFRVMLRSLTGTLQNSQRVVSIAIQFSDGNSRELEEYIRQYFRWTFNVNVYWGTARDFAAELRTRWQTQPR